MACHLIIRIILRNPHEWLEKKDDCRLLWLVCPWENKQ